MNIRLHHLSLAVIVTATAFAIAYPPAPPTWSYYPPNDAEGTTVEPEFTYLLTVTYRDTLASYHSIKACSIARAFIEAQAPPPGITDFISREVLCEAIEVTPYDSY